MDYTAASRRLPSKCIFCVDFLGRLSLKRIPPVVVNGHIGVA